MITLEQIRALDKKVEDAVAMIRALTSEKRVLHEKLDSYRQRIDELEKLVTRFKEDQGKIEEGIEGAIRKLDSIGDGARSSGAPAAPSAPSSKPIESVPDTAPDQGAGEGADHSPVEEAGESESDSDESAEGEEPSVAELDIF